MYDSTSFWRLRGKTYASEPARSESRYVKQEEAILNRLSLLKFDTVLDAGCGYGRISQAILYKFPEAIISGIDVSDDLLEIARENVAGMFVNESVFDIKSQDDTFDLVIASDVLIHLTPSEAEKAIGEMVRVSKRYVVSVDWFDENQVGVRSAEHCWCHPYLSIYGRHRGSLICEPTYEGSEQSIFIFEKGK